MEMKYSLLKNIYNKTIIKKDNIYLNFFNYFF